MKKIIVWVVLIIIVGAGYWVYSSKNQISKSEAIVDAINNQVTNPLNPNEIIETKYEVQGLTDSRGRFDTKISLYSKSKDTEKITVLLEESASEHPKNYVYDILGTQGTKLIFNYHMLEAEGPCFRAWLTTLTPVKYIDLSDKKLIVKDYSVSSEKMSEEKALFDRCEEDMFGN